MTAAIYLDFARAFDSVNHTIQGVKLRCMGISRVLRNWVSGYLSQRQIYTKFNGLVSGVKNLGCGVPQGSVIGPVLFICYINDIVEVANNNSLYISLYADEKLRII